jgi:transposase
MFAEFLTYKQLWRGGFVTYVPAPGTSQTCIACTHKSKDNRHTQARFCCSECGLQGNADWIASVNIETRGQAGKFARKSHDTSSEVLDFSRGLVCGSLFKPRNQKTVGSRETVPSNVKNTLYKNPPLESVCLF